MIAACSGGITQECSDVIATGFATYSANLGVILGSLRAAAGSDAEIAIMTYYNPLGACFLADLEDLADLVLEGGGPLAFGAPRRGMFPDRITPMRPAPREPDGQG